MRRATGGLAGLALLAVALVGGGVPAAWAAPAPSAILVAFVVDEGPAPVAGSKVWFDATLMSGDAPVGGAVLTLLARPYGATQFTPVAAAKTDPNGYASTRVALNRSSTVRWAYAGDAEHEPTTSQAFVRTVGSKVVARTADASLDSGQKLVVTGRSYPAKPGYGVSLWRGKIPCFCVGADSTRVAGAKIRPDGTFRLTVKFANPGSKQLYVKVNAGGGTTTGYSKYLRVRVR